MSIGNKIKELSLPIIAIGGFLGAVQDILSPLNKFGVWAGFGLITFGVFLIVVPETSRIGSLIKGLSVHWKTPLIVSSFVVGGIILTASSFSSGNVEKGGKGLLADNISAFNILQKEVFSLVKETNEIVKDTNKVVKDTNIVVKRTEVVTKNTNDVVIETNENVEVILENTKMTATKLLAERSYSTSGHNDFFRAVDDLEGQELIEVLTLYKDAQLKLSRKVKVYPDLFSDNNDRNLLLLRIPKRANLIHSLVCLGLPIEKIIQVMDVFKDSEYLKTPVADWYANESINPDMNLMASYQEHFHPQRLLGSRGSSVDRSLISYSRNRVEDETTKRGGYSLVHTAASMGDINLLKVLLKRGHSLNQTSFSGYTPLALAIENEQIKTINFILEHSVDVSQNNYIAYEVALLKMLNGYYPFEGYVNPKTGKLAEFSQPQDNPYYSIAKSIGNKIKTKPTKIRMAVKDLYVKHVDLVRRSSLEHKKYPGSYYDKMYTERVKLGEQYISALKAL